MKLPDPTSTDLESALARLMPPALSPSAQASMESMLDELAAGKSARATRPRRWIMGIGIAASVGAMLSVWSLVGDPPEPVQLASQPPARLLVSESSIGPAVVTSQAKCSASYEGPDGSVRVSNAAAGLTVKILTGTGKSLFEKEFPSGAISDEVPEAWRERVDLLHRSLETAAISIGNPSRQPQPRMIPQP